MWFLFSFFITRKLSGRENTVVLAENFASVLPIAASVFMKKEVKFWLLFELNVFAHPHVFTV